MLVLLLPLRLSGVAAALTGVLAAVLEGVTAGAEDAGAGAAAAAAFAGSFSDTGKNESFLMGAHICSSMCKHTSSDMTSSFLSSPSTARPNCFASGAGGGAVFEACFCNADDETGALEALAEDVEASVDERDIGAGFEAAKGFFAEAGGAGLLEEATVFDRDICFPLATAVAFFPLISPFPCPALSPKPPPTFNGAGSFFCASAICDFV